METLTNGKIKISVKEAGAELTSLKSNGREYLWQADKKYWQRHSPVLFPFVGSVWKGEYRSKGHTYKMGQHGLARDMDFVLIDKGDTSIKYRLSSSEATKEKYPYDFILEISYELIDKTVRVGWHVANTGDEPMPFQIGAHPAFFWPMLTNDDINGGIAAMEPKLQASDNRGYFKIKSNDNAIPTLLITEGGCFGDKGVMVLGRDGYLPLSISNFEHDAIVFDGGKVSEVTLCDDQRNPYLTVTFDTPLVGLWSPPGKRAPFVCIEPWYGCADTAGFTGDLFDKNHIQILQPHQCFDAHYDITVV